MLTDSILPVLLESRWAHDVIVRKTSSRLDEARIGLIQLNLERVFVDDLRTFEALEYALSRAPYLRVIIFVLRVRHTKSR
jgi:hypothetical protein